MEPTEPTTALDEGALAAHVRGRLAAYKAPRRVLVVASLDRAANGKVDQRRWRRFAAEQDQPSAVEVLPFDRLDLGHV